MVGRDQRSAVVGRDQRSAVVEMSCIQSTVLIAAARGLTISTFHLQALGPATLRLQCQAEAARAMAPSEAAEPATRSMQCDGSGATINAMVVEPQSMQW